MTFRRDKPSAHAWAKFRLKYRQRLVDAGLPDDLFASEDRFRFFAQEGWHPEAGWNTQWLEPEQAATVADILVAATADYEFDGGIVPVLQRRALASPGRAKYFPEGAFADRMQEFCENWFGRHLDALEEPVLRFSKPAELTVRFLWLRTFHAPVALRTVATHTLVVKRTSGRGGYEPGKLRDDRTVPLSEAEADEVHRRASALWEYRPEEQGGIDGAEWVFELADGDSYHLVTEWTPERGPARELGELLLELSGLEEADVY